MTIQELQQKPKHFEFYHVEGDRITKYEYLCEYPFHNPKNMGSYHILINKSREEPVRVYKERLTKMLEQCVLSYNEALSLVVNVYEERINRYKNRINEILSHE